MTSYYKQIQLTNTQVGAVAANAYIPYGKVTRRINAPQNCCNTFNVVASNADAVQLNDAGFYKITYSLTASSADAGEATINLVTNETSLYSVSQYIDVATSPVNLTLVYTIRVCPSVDALPVSVQIQNTGVALTGVSSNMIIEKV